MNNRGESTLVANPSLTGSKKENGWQVLFKSFLTTGGEDSALEVVPHPDSGQVLKVPNEQVAAFRQRYEETFPDVAELKPAANFSEALQRFKCFFGETISLGFGVRLHVDEIFDEKVGAEFRQGALFSAPLDMGPIQESLYVKIINNLSWRFKNITLEKLRKAYLGVESLPVVKDSDITEAIPFEVRNYSQCLAVINGQICFDSQRAYQLLAPATLEEIDHEENDDMTHLRFDGDHMLTYLPQHFGSNIVDAGEFLLYLDARKRLTDQPNLVYIAADASASMGESKEEHGSTPFDTLKALILQFATDLSQTDAAKRTELLIGFFSSKIPNWKGYTFSDPQKSIRDISEFLAPQKPNAATNTSGTVAHLFDQIQTAKLTMGHNVSVVLISDGQCNAGFGSKDKYREQRDRAIKDNLNCVNQAMRVFKEWQDKDPRHAIVNFDAIALGDAVNEDLLKGLTLQTGGRYTHGDHQGTMRVILDGIKDLHHAREVLQVLERVQSSGMPDQQDCMRMVRVFKNGEPQVIKLQVPFSPQRIVEVNGRETPRLTNLLLQRLIPVIPASRSSKTQACKEEKKLESTAAALVALEVSSSSRGPQKIGLDVQEMSAMPLSQAGTSAGRASDIKSAAALVALNARKSRGEAQQVKQTDANAPDQEEKGACTPM